MQLSYATVWGGTHLELPSPLHTNRPLPPTPTLSFSLCLHSPIGRSSRRTGAGSGPSGLPRPPIALRGTNGNYLLPLTSPSSGWMLVFTSPSSGFISARILPPQCCFQSFRLRVLGDCFCDLFLSGAPRSVSIQLFCSIYIYIYFF